MSSITSAIWSSRAAPPEAEDRLLMLVDRLEALVAKLEGEVARIGKRLDNLENWMCVLVGIQITTLVAVIIVTELLISSSAN